ncbi:MAG: lysoplasmalogenase [Lewinellaceae bacterium]|nr:lysoplasmalogenase [Lewinellaceae bacterium]
MSYKNSFWLAAYAAIALTELVAEISGNSTLVFWTKPLLMPLLAAWFFHETPGSNRFVRYAVLSALGFSTLGDILLMFAHDAEGELFFILGLGSFLLAHLFYTSGFLLRDHTRKHFLLRHPWWAIPFLAFSLALLGWLWMGIPVGLRSPVSFYATAISLTALSVVNLYPVVSKSVFYQLLLGACLFIVSDSLIAVTKFGHPFAGARIAIMLTYILGQWLLASGARIPAARKPDPDQAD